MEFTFYVSQLELLRVRWIDINDNRRCRRQQQRIAFFTDSRAWRQPTIYAHLLFISISRNHFGAGGKFRLMQFENGKQLLFWQFHWMWTHFIAIAIYTFKLKMSNRQIKFKHRKEERKKRRRQMWWFSVQWNWIALTHTRYEISSIFACNWIWFIGIRLLFFLIWFYIQKTYFNSRAFFSHHSQMWSMWVCAALNAASLNIT